MIAVLMPDKTAESIVEAYLSGILSRAGASMDCLSDNGSKLKKNTQMNTFLKQIGIKHIFSSPQGNSYIENVHNFLKTINKAFI